jgi:hypothetical protein
MEEYDRIQKLAIWKRALPRTNYAATLILDFPPL